MCGGVGACGAKKDKGSWGAGVVAGTGTDKKVCMPLMYTLTKHPSAKPQKS